ncbi:MAG: DUF2474 family protein [Hyphomicrobiales bacterium]
MKSFRRLLWFTAIWFVSVACLGLVAFAIRSMIT